MSMDLMEVGGDLGAAVLEDVRPVMDCAPDDGARRQLWIGFLGAVSDYMSGDVGPQVAREVLAEVDAVLARRVQ